MDKTPLSITKNTVSRRSRADSPVRSIFNRFEGRSVWRTIAELPGSLYALNTRETPPKGRASGNIIKAKKERSYIFFFAPQGLQGFFALQGLQGFFAAQGLFAVHGPQAAI
jgi:hypothetical protein